MTGRTVRAGPTEGFRHEALIYRDREDYVHSLRARISTAVGAGEPVLVAVPEPNLAQVREALEVGRAGSWASEGIDPDAVVFANMAEIGRNPGRIIPQVLRSFVDSHPGRRALVFGEPIWATRTPAEYAAAARHEALINLAFAAYDTTIVCPYDAGSLPSAWLADVERTHPVVVESGAQRISPRYRDPGSAVKEFNRPF